MKRMSNPVLGALVTGIAVCSGVTASAQTVITQWDQFAQTGIAASGPAMDELIAKCEPELDGAAILRTVAPAIGIRDAYRLAVSAGKTPDLAYTWPAASVLAGFARNDAVAPMGEYYEEYGWDSLINKFMKDRNSYEGEAYALPMAEDLMGIYYNPELFEEHGVAVPATYAEFKEAVQTFKDAGVTPIAFGNRDRWPATNTFSLILGLTAGLEGEEKVFFGDEPWTTGSFMTAAETFQDWAENGYFPRGFNGIGYDEANALFTSGRAAMNITGTWVIQDIMREASFDVGVFMLPPIVEGVPQGTMWGEQSQWQIAASTDKATRDAAAAYLNCLFTPESRQVWVEKGSMVPIGTSDEELNSWDTPQLIKDFYSAGNATTDTNFYDLHTTIPDSVTQVLYPELQRLLAGDASPEEFLSAIQSSWETTIENNERWIP